MKIKVGVIFGGESVEHEVSIISAIQAMNKMDQEKYDIIPIYITKDREWYTGDMLKDIEVYEQTKITARQGKRLDIESAYIDAGQVIEDDRPREKRYIHIFSEADFPEITKPDILEIRKYKNNYLVLSYQRELEGSQRYWEI